MTQHTEYADTIRPATATPCPTWCGPDCEGFNDRTGDTAHVRKWNIAGGTCVELSLLQGGGDDADQKELWIGVKGGVWSAADLRAMAVALVEAAAIVASHDDLDPISVTP